jgi:hypothetical protein
MKMPLSVNSCNYDRLGSLYAAVQVVVWKFSEFKTKKIGIQIEIT